MNASLKASLQTSRSRLTPVLLALTAVHAAFIPCAAHAQQATNPGDIVLEREVAPRDAFDSVPRSQEPVLSSATTFPANSFNPAMAQLASDSDLTNARGSTGVNSPGGLAGTGMQAVTRILSGNTTGNNVALGAGGIGQPAPGIGGTISSSVTGSLMPLSNALSGALGGMK
ncbi:hypothetical protein [Paraburkholderia humisilvae]|uniref:ESPR domain-containing protein n=1 Tax=Paraburkholderia humisilvae TaxID=627669 RepID=A0A6J5DJT5_9BURK|nr:hypothetical protein [Paraburkholderia humisilvae]CAB3753255.1 hypothetical protein LMG29542_01976 [Paraburkholderia humisilvae]